jgi:hypothetical protein
MQPLYDAGKHAQAADIGPELTEAHRDQASLYDNMACRESLAGRSADPVKHIRRAVDMWEGCCGMAKEDSEFDAIRQTARFPARHREFGRT